MIEKINENITFHYIPMQKLKTSTIGVFVHRQLNEQDASKNAVLPYVLKRGCSMCKNNEELEETLEDLYGASARCGVLKKGTDQILYFTFESISEKYVPEHEPLFSKITALVMSMLFEPVTQNGGFCPSYVEQEKTNAIARIESIKNDKRSYAEARCVEEMCKGNPFRIPRYGTIEGIQAINEKTLYDYYKNILTTSVIDIYVCGECDTSGVIAQIQKYVQDYHYEMAKLPEICVFQKDGDVQKIEESMDVTQGKLSMGFVTGISATDDEYFALMVANSIFGAGAHSKLFNNVREKLSLCYYASSGIERYMGIMTVNAGIEFENYQKAYDEIMVQLDDVKKGNISELEYASSISAIVTSLKACKDDQYAMQSYDLSEKIAGTNRNLDDVIEKILKVTVEDAVRAAQNIKLDTVYFLKGAQNNAVK